MVNATSVKEAYLESSTSLRMQELNTAFLVALALMPMGVVIDFITYDAYFSELSIIRIAGIALLLIAYILYKKQQTKTYLQYFENLWTTIIVVTLCFMIYITGGASSSYYAALNLVIIAATFLLPLNLANSLVMFAITLFAYFVTVILHDTAVFSKDLKIVFNNFYFIILTGIIGCTASYINEKRRFTQFSLRYELNKRNKELAELDRIKSNFFANISHELRTPLTLILSPVEDLLQSDQPFDFKVNQLLTTARDNGYRLLKLVNDILSIIRLDEHDTELECKPVDVQPLLKSIVNSMQHLAEKQKISLHTKIGLDSTIIDANVNALEKIFINLLNNAIKFTPENGEIVVSDKTNSEGITITISDTGIGISEEDLPHIFERFQQADSSATRKYQGTGLGLALVRELTLAQKGRITVDSQLDKGTTFTVFFPFIEEEEESKPAAATANNNQVTSSPLEKLHQKADYALHLNRPDTTTLEPAKQDITNNNVQDTREKLLIVEDEPDLRTYLVNTLSEDYQVFSAADGQAGLDLVIKYKPDLVLLDLMLPKIDGLALCKKIKNDDRLQFTKVVLLTARIDEQSKITALENGADDFITKPFSTTELKTRLSNLSDSLQLEKGLQTHNAELAKALTDLKAAESKLLHSEKLSAIGSLAAGLLHEVNNPLNYTLTAAQILKRDPTIKADEDMLEMVDDIIEGMDRIKAIVKDLHTFAYPEEVDKQQAFVLTDAIDSSLRFTASEKDFINIQVNIPESLEVIGSHSHIVQVLVNLMTNAIKALKAAPKKEGATIDIVAECISPTDENSTNTNTSEPRVRISIRDNGIGIEQEVISRIFEPFYTTRDVGEGLGMGLSICHTIIENHGGSIAVDSELGKFTEFSFDLALANDSGEL